LRTSHDDPDTAVVVENESGPNGEEVTVAFLGAFDDEDILPGKLREYCEKNGIKRYSYEHSELRFC
jgi:hypothetical protein